MMVHMIESNFDDKILAHASFCRMITFKVFLENRDECVKISGKL